MSVLLRSLESVHSAVPVSNVTCRLDRHKSLLYTTLPGAQDTHREAADCGTCGAGQGVQASPTCQLHHARCSAAHLICLLRCYADGHHSDRRHQQEDLRGAASQGCLSLQRKAQQQSVARAAVLSHRKDRQSRAARCGSRAGGQGARRQIAAQHCKSACFGNVMDPAPRVAFLQAHQEVQAVHEQGLCTGTVRARRPLQS